MTAHRSERLAEALREELEELINYELNDPRLASVAITEVLLSGDKKKAHVRLFVQGTADEQQQTMEVIEKATAYLRSAAAERLDMFQAPDLTFFFDVGAPLRGKAHKLLKRIRKGRPRA